MFCLALLALLGACASHGPVTAWQATPASETLALVRLEPGFMEVRLDGGLYRGEWRDGRCFTDACRGVFRDLQRIYRRHIRHGQAELVARDGARMHCVWVSWRTRVRGGCEAADGRIHRLEAGDDRVS